MPAYLIADTHITDQQTYDEYKRQVPPSSQSSVAAFLFAVVRMKCSRVLGSPHGSS